MCADQVGYPMNNGYPCQLTILVIVNYLRRELNLKIFSKDVGREDHDILTPVLAVTATVALTKIKIRVAEWVVFHSYYYYYYYFT